MKNIVVIPAYKPDNKLIELIDELTDNGLGVVVVNDGSGQEYDHIFKEASQKAEVVEILCNSGKGFALKSGFTTVMRKHPDCQHIVTADSDGQHKCCDILRVVEELEQGAEFVLTVRTFGEDMPARSRIGNNLSRYIYTILNGHYLVDNQSGLRGFNMKHTQWLVRVEGNKYDYEMNMLYYADKQGVVITTIPIEAIYIDNNSSSHFHPIKDTLRIYARLFYSARISFAAILLAEQLWLYATIFFGYDLLHITIPLIGATTVAFKVVLNKFVVFRRYRYKDLMRTVIYTLLRYMGYSCGLLAFSVIMPFIPLIVAFNFLAVVFVPVEYLLHKLMYISKYKDINKEIH